MSMLSYESWRITYQSSEQAARAAFKEACRLRHQWQYYQDFCKQNGFDGITAMAVAVDKLREEVAMLTEQRNDHIKGSAHATTQCIEYQHLMAELREENERLLKQQPVAEYDGVEFSRYTLRWANGPVPVGTKLYAAPAVPADVEKLMQILSESARPDVPADRLECPDEWNDEHKQTFSRWVHEEMQNNARRSIIKRARALLQSAEVTK